MKGKKDQKVQVCHCEMNTKKTSDSSGWQVKNESEKNKVLNAQAANPNFEEEKKGHRV